jgi:hypothetical protein
MNSLWYYITRNCDLHRSSGIVTMMNYGRVQCAEHTDRTRQQGMHKKFWLGTLLENGHCEAL